MSSRRRISQRDTRKLARNYFSHTIHEPVKLSRPGAYHFQASGFGRLIIIDDRSLTEAERAVFDPFRATSHLVLRQTPAELHEDTVKHGEFTRQQDADFRSFSDPEFDQKPLWFFLRQAWCLPHIFAGLTCYEDDSPIALKHFDNIFAASHHDRMRARNSLARHQAAA